MPTLSATAATLIADVVLAAHACLVAFVVLGTLAILAGGWRGWSWVRNLLLRVVHLALIGWIAVQAWLGVPCPLTIWEQALRARAGQTAYRESFVQHWLSQLIFFDAAPWVFVVAYTTFALLVAACWWWVRPLPGWRRHRR